MAQHELWQTQVCVTSMLSITVASSAVQSERIGRHDTRYETCRFSPKHVTRFQELPSRLTNTGSDLQLTSSLSDFPVQALHKSHVVKDEIYSFHFIYFSFLALIQMWLLPFLAATATTFRHALAAPTSDACSNIAGKDFVMPQDAVACLKSFQFNQTFRDNVLDVVSHVFDFYSYENYYLNLSTPFQASSVDIRAKLDKFRQATYETDYDFHKDLMAFTTQLHDGHTYWMSFCHRMFQNMLPTPIVSVEVNGTVGVYIAFDSVEIISQMPQSYLKYYEDMGFDWKRLAGAKVVQIEGKDPYEYVDFLADTVVGDYLDKGIRANRVYSSYHFTDNVLSAELGALASSPLLEKDKLTFKLIPANSTTEEDVTVPYVAQYGGQSPFTDSASFWEANCLADESTNGHDRNDSATESSHALFKRGEFYHKGALQFSINLPERSMPTAPSIDGKSGSIKSYILPDKKTGVIYVGDFVMADNITLADAFQEDVESAVASFKDANMERLLIDVTGNPGGIVCMGSFLQLYLAGSKNAGQGGFNSASRANTMTQKIVSYVTEHQLNHTQSIFSSEFYSDLNGNRLSVGDNYVDPPLQNLINEKSDPTSQLIRDFCEYTYSRPIPEDAPFDLSKVAILSNGQCGSTCATFSTAMYEKHNVTIAVFGGLPGHQIEYKGASGGEVLFWAEIDSEIKSAGLKGDPLAASDLLVSGTVSVNIRNSYSYLDPKLPIEFRSEQPQFHFTYDKDTYNNLQKLWEYAIDKIFGE